MVLYYFLSYSCVSPVGFVYLTCASAYSSSTTYGSMKLDFFVKDICYQLSYGQVRLVGSLYIMDLIVIFSVFLVQ